MPDARSIRMSSPGPTCVENPDEAESEAENSSGNDFVLMSTRPPEKLPGLVGREGLQRDDVLEEVAREQVELDGAAVRVGGGQRRAVELRVGVAVAQAADVDVAPALDAGAGHALHGVARVGLAPLAEIDSAEIASETCAARARTRQQADLAVGAR